MLTLAQVGRTTLAAVESRLADRWNPLVRLWCVLVAVVTLGFYVGVANLLVVTNPLSQRDASIGSSAAE